MEYNPEMPAKGWTTISLPKEMVERIKRIIEENPDLGFRSIADFVIISIQGNPEFMKRFEHYNIYQDHVTIFDREKKKLVDVYLRDGKSYCDLCEEFDCEHIRFALSLPKVVEPLREKGWVIKDGKVILPPF